MARLGAYEIHRRALKTLAALTLLAAFASLLLHAAGTAIAQTSTTDYDTDNDYLIEISTLQ